MGSILHAAIACGYLSSFGLSGFALASDVQGQQLQLTGIQISLAQVEIDRDVRNVCQAQVSRNQAALTAWANTLQKAREDFFALAKRSPDMKPCDQILISSNPP